MKKPTDKEFQDVEELNRWTYNYFYDRLCELAMSVFKWENLPDTIDERFLELTLLESGYCLFFKDEVIGYLALPCRLGGELDVYRIPINRSAYATNDYRCDCTKQNSTLIFNNYAHTATIDYVRLFARRLANCERTVDVNVNAQKTPVMILSSDKQRQTMKQLYMRYDGNYPFIMGNKDLDTTGVKSLSTQAPYVADKLTELKQSIWSEALTWLGISNLNLTKKERLISDEVNTNMGFVNTQRFTRLNARQQACNEINRKFGLNVSVSFREDTAIIGSTELTKDLIQDGENVE